MITTSEIAPSPALAPFVRCYAYREFDTNGLDFIKPWFASHEMYIPFFFKAVPVKLVDPETGKILKTGKNCGVVGISSQYNGEMTFNGSYSFFQIIFKANGFNKIFKIPSSEIIDKIVWGDEIFDSGVELLHEQLAAACGLSEMAALANVYLEIFLRKQQTVDYKNGITAAVHLIASKNGLINIDALAHYVNMSRRNFERLFNEAVGTSPKLFCCITRFNHALDLKLRNPGMEWASVTNQAGYFDQMHLIKDFKRFCGEAPSLLLKHVPLLEENYTSRIDK